MWAAAVCADAVRADIDQLAAADPAVATFCRFTSCARDGRYVREQRAAQGVAQQLL
jgi:hypothetical protein